jgi:hypothetical protein
MLLRPLDRVQAASLNSTSTDTQGSEPPPPAPRRSGGSAAPSRLRRRLWVVAVAAAAPFVAFQAAFVATYGLDFHFGDEWNGVPDLLLAIDAGKLGIGDFVAQHNEHRIAVPRALMLALAFATRWNNFANLYAQCAIVAMTAVAAVLLVLRQARSIGRRGAAPALVVLSLIFLPTQYENWLWGFQSQFLLVALFTIVAAAVGAGPAPLSRRIGIAGSLAVAATFTSANGMLLWAVLPLALFAGERRPAALGWGLAWAGLALATAGVYSIGYVRTSLHAPPLESLMHPQAVMMYVGAYVGGPFSSLRAFGGLEAVASLGWAVVALLTWETVAVLRARDPALLRASSPWIAVAAFALGTAVLTALGRLNFGPEQALSPRYVTFAVWVPVAVVMLGWLLGAPRVGRRYPLLFATLAAGVVVLASSSLPQAFADVREWQRVAREKHARQLFADLLVDSRTRHALWFAPDADLFPQLHAIARRGWLRPPMYRSTLVRDFAQLPPDAPGLGVAGRIESVERSHDGKVSLQGWAVFTDARRPADAVLISVEADDTPARILDIASGGVRVPELGRAWGDERLSAGGWVSRLTLPAGRRSKPVTVRAWALVIERNALVPIALPAHSDRWWPTGWAPALAARRWPRAGLVLAIAAAGFSAVALARRRQRLVGPLLGGVVTLTGWAALELLMAPLLVAPLGLQNFFFVLDVDHRAPARHPFLGTNADGLRMPLEADAFAAPGTNLVFLGDSFTYGLRVTAEQAFPEVTAALLRERLGRADVRAANFGWPSASPLLALRQLEAIGARYRPDLVVYALDMTDFHDDLMYARMLERHGIYWWYDKTPITLRALERFAPALFERLHRRFSDGLPRERFFASERSLEETREQLQPVVENLERLAAAARRLGAGFVVVVLPRSYQYSARESPHNWEAPQYTTLGPWSAEPFRFFASIRDQLSFPVLSLLETFQRASAFPTCFPDDPHWTPAGHRLAAEAIATFLAPELGRRTSATTAGE